jgi:hypothetical protein
MILSCAASISLIVGSSTSGSFSSVWQPVQSSMWCIWRSSSFSLNSFRRLAFLHPRLIIVALRRLKLEPVFPQRKLPFRLFSPAVHAAHQQFPKFASATMTNRQTEIVTKSPFIPSLSPICRVADTVLMFAISAAALAAALIVLIRQVF